MPLGRRALLKTSAASLSGAAVVGTANANEEWTYEFTSAAPVPGAADCTIQDGWAYVAALGGIATYDLNDPESPEFGGAAPGSRETHDNRDVKVDGDVVGLADNGDPGGVTFYDVSDPADPTELSFYDADTGVHNHFIDGDYAYLTIIESGEASFSDSRMAVVDISDPEEPEHVADWALKDYREDMAMAGTNPLHDMYVQDGYCYMCWWNAGVIVADVTDPENPRAVAHFGAHPETATQEEPEGLEYYRDYAGDPENAHTVQPTPDREYTVVGTESFSEPTGTVLSDVHGGIRIFHTPKLAECPASSLAPIAPRAGQFDFEGEGKNPRSLVSRADPFNPAPIDLVRAPELPENPPDAVRTAHNFDLTNDKAVTSWYQSGIRAYDFSTVRTGAPDEGELDEIAEFDMPVGDFYWTAELLDIETEPDQYFTVASDTGKGLQILELARQEASDDPLGAIEDVLGDEESLDEDVYDEVDGVDDAVNGTGDAVNETGEPVEETADGVETDS